MVHFICKKKMRPLANRLQAKVEGVRDDMIFNVYNEAIFLEREANSKT